MAADIKRLRVFIAGAPRIIGALFEVETTTSTRPAIPGDVSTISYTVTEVADDGTETAITSGNLTPVASYIFDPVREATKPLKKFKKMDTWNFEHKAPATFFPEASVGKKVRIKYEFKDGSGVLIADPFVIEKDLVSYVASDPESE